MLVGMRQVVPPFVKQRQGEVARAEPTRVPQNGSDALTNEPLAFARHSTRDGAGEDHLGEWIAS